YLREAGIGHVYQLDGGILSYFASCGSAHFDGECFVFDDRRGVDAALQPRVDVGPSSDTQAPQAMGSLAV
ncbi:MAG: Rhodanese domain protein, partial [Polaromonas sp.]|nr:Rhodanese domain protein [Polaromonas sp.]